MTKTFFLLSFLLPFQLSLHFNKLTPLIYGFSIDYLTPVIYITDIVVFGIIITWFRKTKFKITRNGVLVVSVVSIFVLANLLASSYLIPSIYKWIKVFELCLLVYIIKNEKGLKVFDHFVKPLSYSIVIVCTLAIWQFFNQGSVGGLFYLLGERVMRFSDPGISPFPYSTFSHPNSLAGFLLVYSLLLINYKKEFEKKYLYVLSILLITTLFLTSSLNVLLAMVTIFVIYKFKVSKKNIVILIFLVSLATPFLKIISSFDQSVVDRVKLARASVEMFKSNPVVGVGLNNFIPNLIEVSYGFENSWQLQPVHNIFLLALSEAGILGFIFLLFLLFLPHTIFFILPILLTGLFDHYWLTLQQNMLLMAMIIGFSFGKIKEIKKL